MPSENSGNKIVKINILQTKVSLYFDNKEKIDITHDIYTSHYFYVGKELSLEEIREIRRQMELSEGLAHARALCAKASYSEWKIREKLYEDNYSKSVIDDIVIQLKKDKFINDKRLAKEIVQYGNEKLWGKRKIIAELKKRGIFDTEINQMKFTDASELTKARKLVKVYEKKYEHDVTSDKRRHIFDALVRDGYSTEIASSLTKKIEGEKANTNSNKINRDFSNALVSALKKCKTLDGVKANVFKTMLAKGYIPREIRILWEEKEDEIAERLRGE